MYGDDESSDKRMVAAVSRKREAESDERYLTGQIEYHAAQASRLRKERQKARSKKDRANAAILRIASE